MATVQSNSWPIPSVAIDELMADPVGRLAAARAAAPVICTEACRNYALRAEDVRHLASDPRVVQIPGRVYADVMGFPAGRTRSFVETIMLFSNGAEHVRRRGAFNRAFSHPVIRGMRGRIRSVADTVVAELPRGREFDFLALCASPLPARTIAEILGLEPSDTAEFTEQVYSLGRALAPPYDLARHDEVEAAADALYAYVAETLDARRSCPQDDLLTRLVADDSARALGSEELILQVVGLILAGSDTTRAAFAMTVGRLLEDRSRWNKVMARRELIPAAIDEALRLEPPVAALPRSATAPIEVGGVTVPPGQILGLSTLSAMRDPAQHADPDSFDLHRTDHSRPHLVFGLGAHRCLGEMLARTELEEGVAALMDAAPGIEMVEAPRMVGFGGLRHATPLVARID